MSSSLEDTAIMSNHEYYNFLEISYKAIASATNNFDDANLVTQGTSFRVYKGQLLHLGYLIDIVARKCMQVNVGFNELMMCKYLKHKNIYSIFKLAKKDDEPITIINKYMANGSLDKHLQGSTLTWMQRLQICVGVAHALFYIHYDAEDNHYVIHCNIKSSKILLDDNWEPKLNGFGFATRVKRHHVYLTSKYNGAVHYMDPAYEKTKALTYKSDVFSFGVVLFEVLFGRNAFISFPNEDHWYFARLARLHYEERTLDDMIDPSLLKQMDLQSFNIFSETAYCCLKELRAERPDMDQIVKRLETALELQQKHHSLEHSPPVSGGIMSNYLKDRSLDNLKIRLADIELATNNFSVANYIGSGGYGMVYKAELDHFKGQNSSVIKGKNKDEFPKTRSTVAIKRLFSRLDGQGEEGFLAEIELLSKCKHPNVISLLGFCEEGRERILVYEHASHGSLNEYLGNVNNMTNLTWAQRLQICLDIANGLNYLHTNTQDKQMMIHRDIKSDNILLDDNWVAKIADFGLSKLRSASQNASTLNTVNIAGTEVYLDPEYLKTGKLKKESDIYSFGVVLFEIMCGRVAYDEIFNVNNEKGLPSTIRRCFSDGTLKEIVDPKLKEPQENIFMLNGGLDQDSLNTFLKIAYQCLANTQAERPTTKVVIKELEKALYFQKNSKDNLQISLEDIESATQNFSDYKCIGEGRYWKQYGGEIPHANANVVVKRFDNKSDKGNHQFLTELKILLEHKHKNIIALVGYCNERDEKIIVYEHAPNGSLDKHLNNGSLTWMKRLKICTDIANGLAFLHASSNVTKGPPIIHRDIKSASIVLDGDFKAKISNFELSSDSWENEDIEHVTHSLAYVDPRYKMEGRLTEKSDIYSLGIVLIEVLSGRLAWPEGCQESPGDLIQIWECTSEALDKLVFEDLKEHSSPESLITVFEIASACLVVDYIGCQPDASEVLIQLNKAFELQEDYEIWEPKLPTDYIEIFRMSDTPEISKLKKKDLYDMLTEGILLQEGKLWFVFGGNGERNEMISATKFTYKNRWLHKWQSIPESRFQKVAQMLDISNLKIKINIKAQLLSPGVNYAVHLVFKYCRFRKSTAKWIYVNLKYKRGSDNLHACFATGREDGWMMIELCRFLNHKNDTKFEFVLESFSRSYCGSRVVYVEGIEFRAIDNVKYEEMDVQQVLESCSSLDEVQQSPIEWREILKRFGDDEESKKIIDSLLFDEQFFSLHKVNGKKHLMLSAIGVLYDSSKVNPFHLKLSAEWRFQVAIELLPQQVFGIKCKIGSQMLSQDTNYVCYLLFKLSEKCHGLHFPVRVRNVLQWKNKEIGLVCFRPPNPCNLHDNIWVPKKREDGWMEIIVWKFNSTSNIRNDHIPMHLKLITYQGTMSGLIVYGLEIRAM